MTESFRIFLVFGAGLLSFFSPCVLPLIPGYICFITGLSIDELSDSKDKKLSDVRFILRQAILFVLGFSVVFVALGASATFLGSFLFAKKEVIRIVAGAIVIIFGLHIMGLVKLKFLDREAKLHIKGKPLNMLGSFLVGGVFGFAWMPCIGPILGSILALAATRETLAKGILLLSVFSLGLAIPFLLVSVAIERFLRLFSKIKRFFKLISVVSGILLIVLGIGIILSAF